ncbi:hypothetical protein PV433_21750 [Paenibacillus sp. GYB004]|uniref:hypothetical protein n=1 Tax=Paenibacillus sp. GYB004 TaxID=2994393 RepID=UPI002F965E2D
MGSSRFFLYRINIFGKIVLMVVLLLAPVLILYSFSNRITNQVVHEQLQSSNLNQLSVFMHQVDSAIDNLSMFPVILGQDPHIRDYLDRSHAGLTDLLKEQGRITEKLGLQSVSSGWSNDLTIVFPGERKVLSSNIYLNGGTDCRGTSGFAAAGRTGKTARAVILPMRLSARWPSRRAPGQWGKRPPCFRSACRCKI